MTQTLMKAMIAVLVAGGGMSDAEYQKLCKEARIKSQPWGTVPWHVSLTEARERALREKKPIFMVLDTGHPLGFT